MTVANLLSENVHVKRRPLFDRADFKKQISTGSFKTRATSEDGYPLRTSKEERKHGRNSFSPSPRSSPRQTRQDSTHILVLTYDVFVLILLRDRPSVAIGRPFVPRRREGVGLHCKDSCAASQRKYIGRIRLAGLFADHLPRIVGSRMKHRF
jgi:hypothetical protein